MIRVEYVCRRHWMIYVDVVELSTPFCSSFRLHPLGNDQNVSKFSKNKGLTAKFLLNNITIKLAYGNTDLVIWLPEGWASKVMMTCFTYSSNIKKHGCYSTHQCCEWHQ